MSKRIEDDSKHSRNLFNAFANANQLMLIIGEVEKYDKARILYPPSFVVLENRLVEPGLSSRSGLFTEGTLTPYEAAAALYLSHNIDWVLQSGAYSSDFIEGTTQFGKQLSIAAGIRGIAKGGFRKSSSGGIWSQMFRDPLDEIILRLVL